MASPQFKCYHTIQNCREYVMKALVKVLSCDIGQTPAKGLITAVNSGEMWYGGIDRVIETNAGSMFHSQLRSIPLVDGKAIVAK
ncbi:MAG: hypothetical protein ACD_28C00275G0001, partial [uncultured bacterium]